jgi:hypothetical protein
VFKRALGIECSSYDERSESFDRERASRVSGGFLVQIFARSGSPEANPTSKKVRGGFAGFRETATKTNSLVDRLEELTLPELSDVEGGLERYLDVTERAEELDAKIERTDQLIDEIVYELYGLDEEEIEIVEEAVASDA